MYGSVFFVIQNIFTKLEGDISSLHGLFHWLGSAISRIGPALIGVGLGRNPSGFVNDFFDGYRPLVRKAPAVLIAGCAVEVGLWILALRHSIDNWTFALLTIALVVLLPRVGVPRSEQRPAVAAETPLELVGLERPFTEADVQMLNNHLRG